MILELFWLVFGIILYILLGFFTFCSILNLITAFFSLKVGKKYETITPRVSVVIRAWNDCSVLERCIQGYLNQEYPRKEIEIIIVDDGSTDSTKSICDYYANRGEIKYVRFDEHHELKAEVIDNAIKNFATGEIILETDVDAVLPNNWIKEMVKPFSDQEIGGVTGTAMCGNWFQGSISRVRAIENFWHLCASLYGRFRMSGRAMLYGGCKAYRKHVWLEVGGHPRKTLVEDAEISLKILDAGYKIAVVKSVPIVQEEVTTFQQYLVEQKRWVKGNFNVADAYGPILKKNPLDNLLLITNFGWDGILFLSFVLLPYQLLLIIPILLSLTALYIAMWGLKARGIFFLFAPIYLWVGPLLRATVIFSLLKHKLLKRPVTWEKVWHHSTPLRWPTYD